MKFGTVIEHAENPDSSVIASYKEIREMALTAESHGLDSIWLFDHLLFRFKEDKTDGIWEGWTLLSALAEVTERVELGTLVLCNPFRNPALLAKMAHTLDEVSNGRLILGIGAGWHQPEFEAFGFPFDKRVGRLEESLQILPPLLKWEKVTYSGEYYSAKNCEIVPTSPRKEGVPLLIGAFQPRMLRLTAQYADMWNTGWLGEPEGLKERIDALHAACDKAGRDKSTLDITCGIAIAFPDLGDTTPFAQYPLSGTTEELAEAFRGYEALGTKHLIIQVTPWSETAVSRVAEAINLFNS